MPHEFDLAGVNPSASSLAGFGYQDSRYSPIDGMSPAGPTVNYNTTMGSVTADDPFDAIVKSVDKNNAWSAEQAQKQMDFQIAANDKAMAFSSEQAALDRDWQKMMSDTAHQREVVDLQRAGLNPVLSASGGNGASIGSGASAAGVTSAGAKADGDQSGTSAMMAYFAKLLEAQTSILNTQTSANAALTNSQLIHDASLYGTDMQRYLGELSYDQSLNDAEKYALYNLRRGLGDVGYQGMYETPAAGKAKDIYDSGDYNNVPSDPKEAEKWWREKLGSDYNPAVTANYSNIVKNKDGSINTALTLVNKTANGIKKWIDRIRERNMNED